MILEHTVFFDHAVDDGLLIAVNPAGQDGGQKVKGLYADCRCRKRSFVILFGNNITRLVRGFARYELRKRYI